MRRMSATSFLRPRWPPPLANRSRGACPIPAVSAALFSRSPLSCIPARDLASRSTQQVHAASFPTRKTFPECGSEAIFFGGGNLAVHYKNDVIFIQMLVGKTPAEKLAFAKAVAQKVINHL